MSANPHANGGLLLRDLELPDFRDYARRRRPARAPRSSEATRVLGELPARRRCAHNPHATSGCSGPDETASNRLGAVFEVDRPGLGRRARCRGDDHLAPDGRVMEVLSRAPVPGLAGGLPAHRPPRAVQLLRGVHPHHRLDVQPARQVAEGHARHPVAAADRVAELPAVLATCGARTTTASRHQDPGFIDHVVNKKAEVVRVYLPPDANTLLSVADHCLRSRNYVNVIVAGKQPALNYLSMDEAIAHCTRGLGIWDWASNDDGGEPDVVLACAGDVPTLETLAAVDLLREHLPDLRVRVVNVVDLMRLQPDARAPARPVRPRVRRAVHHRPAGDLRLPRLPVADPPAHLPAHATTTTSTCAATRRRAPPPRRSTW